MNYTRVIPVGGCGEIGLNITAIESGGAWLFVDAGLLFPEDRKLGIDYYAPDLSWFHENGVVPEAWLITHGHEDHIGALPHLYEQFPAKIFAPPLAAAFIREKFAEAGITNFSIVVVEGFQTQEFANFFVTPISMAHSIPDSCGYVVDTLDGKILLTGDFRVDEKAFVDKYMAQFRDAIGRDGIDLLLADSTNAMVPGRDFTEDVVAEEMAVLMGETSGKILVVSFSSSIWRFQSVLASAKKTNRKVYFFGRSMERNLEIVRKLNMLSGLESVIIGESELGSIPDEQLCVLASGSQGEIFSGAFRLALGQVKSLVMNENDLIVLSARTIPGNERAVSTLLNHFARRAVRIVTARERTVHVSGHGFVEDICDLLRFVQPKNYLPIHGQYRQLQANAELAVKCGVARENAFVLENGSVLELRKGVCRVALEKVFTGRLSVSQSRIVDKEIVRQRESMAYGGIVVAAFFLLKDGRFAATPKAIMRGVAASESDLQEALPHLFEKAQANFGKKKQPQQMEDLVRTQIRRWVEHATSGVRAVVSVLIQRVE